MAGGGRYGAAVEQSPTEQVDLAAEAIGEGCIEQGCGQRKADRDVTDERDAGEVAKKADNRKPQTYGLCEARWDGVLELGRSTESGPDQSTEDPCVRGLPHSEAGPGREEHGLQAEQRDTEGPGCAQQDQCEHENGHHCIELWRSWINLVAHGDSFDVLGG